jgi:hypothetical protein
MREAILLLAVFALMALSAKGEGADAHRLEWKSPDAITLGWQQPLEQ